MINGTAAARGAEHLMRARDTRLRSVFTALDDAHLTWCLLRGAATLLDGSGRDLDLLLRGSHLASFEDLVFGLEEGRPEYVDKSLAGLAWVFPGASAR